MKRSTPRRPAPARRPEGVGPAQAGLRPTNEAPSSPSAPPKPSDAGPSSQPKGEK